MWTNVNYTNKIRRPDQYLVKQQIQICLTVLHIRLFQIVKTKIQGFPGGAVIENLPADAGDTGSSPGLGRSHMPRSN